MRAPRGGVHPVAWWAQGRVCAERGCSWGWTHPGVHWRARQECNDNPQPFHTPLGAAGNLYHIRWAQDPDSGELRLQEYWRDPVSRSAAPARADAGSEGAGEQETDGDDEGLEEGLEGEAGDGQA